MPINLNQKVKLLKNKGRKEKKKGGSGGRPFPAEKKKRTKKRGRANCVSLVANHAARAGRGKEKGGEN